MKTPACTLFIFLLIYIPAFSQDLSNDDAARFKYAKESYATGKYSTAIEYCSDILYRKPNAEVYELRAKCYRASGNYEDAVKDYTEAVQRKRIPELYQAKGMCNFCIEKYKEAESDLTEAIRLALLDDPNMASYNYLMYEARGRTYLQMGQYSDAIADLIIAAENGSNTAAIEILSPLLHNRVMNDIAKYTSDLLNPQSYTASFADSSLKHYVTALYKLSANDDAATACSYIDDAISQYKNFEKSCYKSFINDFYYAKAVMYQSAGNDSVAYAFYSKTYNANSRQTDIKSKIENLKIKLGIDVIPPTITLVNPQPDLFKNNSINVTESNIELYGKVLDTSGVLSLTVNNKNVSKLEEDGLFVTMLSLQPGANMVVIEATDKFENKASKTIKFNLIESDTVQKEDVSSIPELFTYANYYAVLIGEKDYSDPSFQDLESPAADALDLKKILSTYYQFDAKHITTLINSSRAGILDSLTNISSALKEDDNLLVFYAGHGALKKLGSQILGGYLVPSDAKKDSYSTYIKSDDLKEAIQGSEAKHILFVVDACFGGTLFRATMDEAPKKIQELYKQKSRLMISSANQEETPDKSEFIKNLKDFFTQNPNAYVSSLELYNYLLKNIESGIPQRNKIKDLGDTGGDFIFVKK